MSSTAQHRLEGEDRVPVASFSSYFAAVRGLQPARYDVVTDAAVAEDAARLLREREA